MIEMIIYDHTGLQLEVEKKISNKLITKSIGVKENCLNIQ